MVVPPNYITCIDDWRLVQYGLGNMIVVGKVHGDPKQSPIFTGPILRVDARNHIIDTASGKFRLLRPDIEYIDSIFAHESNEYIGPTQFYGPDTLRDLLWSVSKYEIPEATNDILNVTLTGKCTHDVVPVDDTVEATVRFELNGSNVSAGKADNTDFYVIVDTVMDDAMTNIKAGLRQLVSRLRPGDGRTRLSDRISIITGDGVLLPLSSDRDALEYQIQMLMAATAATAATAPLTDETRLNARNILETIIRSSQVPLFHYNTHYIVMTSTEMATEMAKEVAVFSPSFILTDTLDVMNAMDAIYNKTTSAVATNLVLSVPVDVDVADTGFNRYGAANSRQLIVPALKPGETRIMTLRKTIKPSREPTCITMTMRQNNRVVNCTVTISRV